MASLLALGAGLTGRGAAQATERDRIVFTVGTPFGRKLATIRPDGSGLRVFTRREDKRRWDTGPAWSPDGRRIAFRCARTEWRDRGGDICIVGRDGTRRRRLTADKTPDLSPAWAPGGRRLVFPRAAAVNDGIPDYELFTIRTDGTHLKQITDDGLDGTLVQIPDWSPDGDLIVFELWSGFEVSLYTIRPDGSELTELSPDLDSPGGPEWSPKGKRIAFDQFGGRGYRSLYTMKADGTDVTKVGRAQRAEGGVPSWSPDGRRLVFQKLVDHNDMGLFVIRTDGSKRRRLHYDGTGSFGPDWGPSR